MFELFNNQHHLIILSLLSTKLWDIAYILLSSLINAFLWENRTYTSNTENTSELYRILKKVSNTYYFSSETRLQFETEYLFPTGYVFGPNYVVYIKTNLNDIHMSTSNHPPFKKIIIHVFGWFSIRSLITEDIVSKKRGKYNIMESGIYSCELYESTENFPEEFFHKNTYIASKYIYESVIQQYNHSGVYLLCGIPNTGKTTTAKKLFDYFEDTSVICPDILSPPFSIPTLTKSALYFYNKVKPEKDKYLIFILDEVDVIIDEMMETKNNTHFYETLRKPTKQAWNSFLEKISTLNNVVLLLTTNKTKEYFDTKDKSLFREHRVTKSFQFDNDGVTEYDFSQLLEDEKPAEIVTPVEPESVAVVPENTINNMEEVNTEIEEVNRSVSAFDSVLYKESLQQFIIEKNKNKKNNLFRICKNYFKNEKEKIVNK